MFRSVTTNDWVLESYEKLVTAFPLSVTLLGLDTCKTFT